MRVAIGESNIEIIQALLNYGADPIFKVEVGIYEVAVIESILIKSPAMQVEIMQLILDISIPKEKDSDRCAEIQYTALSLMYEALSKNFFHSNRTIDKVFALKQMNNFKLLDKDANELEGYNHNKFIVKITSAKNPILCYWQSKYSQDTNINNLLKLSEVAVAEKHCKVNDAIAMCAYLFKNNKKSYGNLIKISKALIGCKKQGNNAMERDYYKILVSYYSESLAQKTLLNNGHKVKKVVAISANNI